MPISDFLKGSPMLSMPQLVEIMDRPENSNMRSFMTGLRVFGANANMDRPHRIAQYVAQIGHETMRFRYDREVWDGKGAQARYDVRTDLGNTPERDGDGYKYRGRTGIQITGKTNYTQFSAWARKMDPNAPDFVDDPDKANTDPWEGLGPLWYWDSRDLNKYADQGNNEMVTRRINGGLNGYADRLAIYDRAALVLLGYEAEDVRKFQVAHGLAADNISGPVTRGAMHNALKSVKEGQPKDSGPLALIDDLRGRLSQIADLARITT